MSKKTDITGKVYSRLTVLSYFGKLNKTNRWLCQCICGNKIITSIASLNYGSTKSCGCYGKEQRLKGVIEKKTKHGKTCGGNQRIYIIWANMITRCTNEKSTQYKWYGARGIKVCDRWRIFQNFLDDMGDPSKEMTLDRIDVNKDYSPENCRWATRKEQANNTRGNVRHMVNGENLTIAQISEKYKINYGTLWSRLKRGDSIEKAIR